MDRTGRGFHVFTLTVDIGTKARITQKRTRLHFSFPIRMIYPYLSGECLSTFESGEQICPVNNSPSCDTSEQSG